MGLLTALTSTLQKPKEFIFDNFKENFKQNQRFLQIQFKKMKKGFNVISNRRAIGFYIPNILDQIDRFTLDMMVITNSESFSFNFAHIITCAKAYAINYIATNEGKTYNEVEFAFERLNEMVDCLNFNYLAHINCETDFEAIYKNDNIYVDKNSYASFLLKMVNKVNEIILSIAQGIYDKDRDPVFKGFINLCDKNLYKLEDINKTELEKQ